MHTSFHIYLKRLRTAAVLEALWACTLAMNLILAVGLLLLNPGSWHFPVALAAAATVESLLYLLYRRSVRMKIESCSETIAFSVPQSRVTDVLQGEIGQRIDETSFLCFERSETCDVRELIQLTECFDAKQLGTDRKRLNKAINKTLKQTSTTSLYTKDYRINLVVFNSSREAAQQWVGSNAEMFLRRTEAIVNAAIDRSTNELLFPVLRETIDLRQYQRYRAALLLLKCQFAFEFER